ncbi:MAG: hypothetical protein D6776_00805 [Planctomycetota bacterium]|nr:MAG: hypothetical protein D6776_00805 [Planctomycetota bacterium]
MDGRITNNPGGHEGWSRYDPDTVERMQGEWGADGIEIGWRIDHGASARNNLKMLADVGARFAPDQTLAALRSATQTTVDNAFDSPLQRFAEGTLKVAGGMLRDVGEIPALTLLMLKDASDAAVHGLVAGWQKLTG